MNKQNQEMNFRITSQLLDYSLPHITLTHLDVIVPEGHVVGGGVRVVHRHDVGPLPYKELHHLVMAPLGSLVEGCPPIRAERPHVCTPVGGNGHQVCV